MGDHQTIAEKGRHARELAQLEYDERRVKRENAERSRAEKKKRAPVARNLDSQDGGGYFASLGAEPVAGDVAVPVAALQYLRERLSTVNLKEPLQATRLSAPSGHMSLAITKLSNQIHTHILLEEQYVANLESRKDEFGLCTLATTTPDLLKDMLNASYVRSVDVLPPKFGIDVNAYIIVRSRDATTLYNTVSAYGTRAGL